MVVGLMRFIAMAISMYVRKVAPAITYASIAAPSKPNPPLNAPGALKTDGVTGSSIREAKRNIHFMSVTGEWREVSGFDIAKYTAEENPLSRISRLPETVPADPPAPPAESTSHIAPAAPESTPTALRTVTGSPINAAEIRSTISGVIVTITDASTGEVLPSP